MKCKFCEAGIAHYQEAIFINATEACCMNCEHMLYTYRREMTKPHYLMQFFGYHHLPERLQCISAPFWNMANQIDVELPDNFEKTMALRKLLESKDCAVRACIYKQEDEQVQ